MAEITLYEGGLRSILESSGGPVARHIERKTEQVHEAAVRNAERIVPVAGPYVITRTQTVEGVTAGVVTLDRANIEGSISAYLAAKQTHERGWLTDAFREVFEGEEFFA